MVRSPRPSECRPGLQKHFSATVQGTLVSTENIGGYTMPGNTVVINGSPELTYYVGDSKLELLLALLREIGHLEQERQVRPEPQTEIRDHGGITAAMPKTVDAQAELISRMARYAKMVNSPETSALFSDIP